MIDKLIIDSLTKNIDFVPDYTAIKDRVAVEKYIEPRKKFNFNFRFFSLLAAAVMILCAVIVPVSLDQRVTYIDGDKIIYGSDKEFIDAYDYVFIAKVTKKLGTKRYDGTGTPIPYTFYSLDVEEFFKGDGERSEMLCFYGGKNILGTELFTMNDQMPTVGEYYLFIANRRREHSTNKRIGEKDFIIADNDNKILLENYKAGIPLTEQEESTRLTVQRYKNIIDKTTGTTAAPLYFENEKALVEYFDYIFIAKLENGIRVDGCGIGSEVASAFYVISVLHKFKPNAFQYSGRICVYGVDYWGTGGVTAPQEDNVYLIFANKKTLDNKNERLGKDDFIISANCQMILLKNYNPDEGYMKQSENIIQILNRYLEDLE